MRTCFQAIQTKRIPSPIEMGGKMKWKLAVRANWSRDRNSGFTWLPLPLVSRAGACLRSITPSIQGPDRGPRGAWSRHLWVRDGILQPMEDFKDPKQEWRRLFSELFGTFFLVLAAGGG